MSLLQQIHTWKIEKDDAICVLIDMQTKLLPAMSDPKTVEENVIRLVQGMKALGIPTVVTQQYTKGLGPTVPAVAEALGAFEPIDKTSFSCIGEPVFAETLENSTKGTVILAGIEAHICVEQTALDLIREGYLTEAVLNYVALLGWSPKGENAEREFYTLSELAEIFDISGISKSPAVFDINKLRWMNAEYMKKLSPEAFFAKAEPVLKTVITNPAIDLKAVAALVQPRCEILSDLPERVDFIDRLPEYSTELYVHKKSKTTLENSLSSLREILPVLESLEVWTNEGLYEALVALAAKLELKNSVVLWPLRVAVSGKASTPGGATELCALLGKEESIARVKAGIALLEKS